jgi:uncharacterized protein YecE (DUF72 family)
VSIRIGTAGWSIPRASAAGCPGAGTHLHRYARTFCAAEINSSFHRPHAASTYAKWADCVSREFRFAVKVPRAITHDARLRRSRSTLEQFLGETRGLGQRRGPLLVQLPPSFEFDSRVVKRFFDLLRTTVTGSVVCEPRHATWFTERADGLLRDFRVARVAADPPPVPGANQPGGWPGLVYFRLHGSPRMYWSHYAADFLEGVASRLRDGPAERWCIFDNTAGGAALANALELQRLLSDVPSPYGSRLGK